MSVLFKPGQRPLLPSVNWLHTKEERTKNAGEAAAISDPREFQILGYVVSYILISTVVAKSSCPSLIIPLS